MLANLPGARALSADKHYDLSIPAAGNSNYTARATVRAGSKQETDLLCKVMEVSMLNGNIAYSSVTAGNVVNGSPDPCWVR